MKRPLVVAIFLFWIVTIIGAYYVVQKPSLVSEFGGLADTLWTLIVAATILFNAYSIGRRILTGLGLQSIDYTIRLLLGPGIGLGALGLLGLGLSAAQLARSQVIFLFFLVLTSFFLFENELRILRGDLQAFAAHWNLSFSQYNLLSKLAVIFPFAFASLLTLAPQFEAFDALLYHWAQPARVLQDNGLRAIGIAHFWFPNLTENIYLLALGLGSERATQIIHLSWGTLSILLLWHWATYTWNMESGRKTLLLLATVPSLPILASWAYADMALTFYATASIYALSNYKSGQSRKWLHVGAVMAGLAMTVKYTSFTVPLTGALLILLWQKKQPAQMFSDAFQFSLIALVIAIPWYVRNVIIMGNPFYPFVFGGLDWDAFRSQWYAGVGTGIGWDPLQLLLLPLNAILGYRDQNFFDGRMGPLFLILAPFTVWILLSHTREDSSRNLSLQAIGLFSVITFAAWTFGVINSIHLWQSRLLFPALIPFAIPTALGWDSLRGLDTPRFRISFFSNVIIGLVIALVIFENGAFVLRRNPLGVAAGIQTKEQYIERTSPSYAALIQLVDKLPQDARMYSLFEPRSYALPRFVQPDVINSNFSHDLYYQNTASGIINYWKTEGYTHIIINNAGANLESNDPESQFTPAAKDALRNVISMLELVGQTPDAVYSIYEIP